MFRTCLSIAAVTFLVLAHAHVSAAAPQSATSRSGGKPATAAVLNINTATAADFETLPGIGAKTAARIIEYRQKNGPFKKVEELMNVRGVGEKSFLKLKAQLSVTTAKADHQHQ